MNPQRERDMLARRAAGGGEPPKVESTLMDVDNDASKEARVVLQAVPRGGRYGAAGRELELGINCFRASMVSTPDKVTQFNLDFFSERVDDPAAAARGGRGGRGARGGRGMRGGRGRGGRGGAAAPDEKPPPLRIATLLVQQIQNGKAMADGGLRFPDGCRLAYDGRKNVYTSERPDWSNAVFKIQHEDKMYKVQFRACATADIDHLKAFIKQERSEMPDAALNCLDIAMRTRPLREFVLTGRSFSLPNAMDGQSAVDKALGHGCEAWRGYYQALKPVAAGLGLFFDVSYSAFYIDQTLLEFAVDLLRPRGQGLHGGEAKSENPFPNGFTSTEHRILRNELRGLRCEQFKLPAGQRKEKIIDELTVAPATQLEFDSEQGMRTMTVAEHYADIMGKLHCPHLPCVEVSGKRGKPTYIPMELARLCAGQRRTKRMPNEMTSKLINVASRTPDVRRSDILKMLEAADHNDDEYMRAFGIKIDTVPMTVKARLLDPPILQYKDVALELPADSPELNWSVAPTAGPEDASAGEGRSRQLFRTKNALKAWGVLVLAPTVKDTAVQNFVKCLTAVCENAGLQVAKPRYKYGYVKSMLSDMRTLADQVSSSVAPCQLILVVKSDLDATDYNRIKLIGDTMVGVPTQCVVQQNVESPREVYCQNVMLKVNAKLGGINVRVSPDAFTKHIGEQAWMIVGADLSHAPAADAMDDASVTACVGTMDRSCSSHVGKFRLQDSKTETISDIGVMVKQLLVAFNAKNGFLPEKLLVYRDGVSDGQFQTVLTEEVHAIKEECHGLGKEYDLPGGYQPTITFVILQKGHHTRFFPLSEAEKDVSGNCRAGTVIDSDVTNARNYDFYLFSHNGIQGTSRPVRYTVLYDDNNMAPDALQSLTYNMCFTYARCTRTVSVVPVAYYADLLAARGRAYLSGRKSAEGKKGRGGLSGGARPGGELSDALIGGFAGEPIVCQAISDRLFYI